MNDRHPAGIAALALTVMLCSVGTALGQMLGSFDDADTNHDGHVSLQEFEAYATPRLLATNSRRAQRFRSLSPPQQAAVLQRRFDRMDHGHKGYLDRNDWKKE